MQNAHENPSLYVLTALVAVVCTVSVGRALELDSMDAPSCQPTGSSTPSSAQRASGIARLHEAQRKDAS